MRHLYEHDKFVANARAAQEQVVQSLTDAGPVLQCEILPGVFAVHDEMNDLVMLAAQEPVTFRTTELSFDDNPFKYAEGVVSMGADSRLIVPDEYLRSSGKPCKIDLEIGAGSTVRIKELATYGSDAQQASNTYKLVVGDNCAVALLRLRLARVEIGDDSVVFGVIGLSARADDSWKTSSWLSVGKEASIHAILEIGGGARIGDGATILYPDHMDPLNEHDCLYCEFDLLAGSCKGPGRISIGNDFLGHARKLFVHTADAVEIGDNVVVADNPSVSSRIDIRGKTLCIESKATLTGYGTIGSSDRSKVSIGAGSVLFLTSDLGTNATDYIRVKPNMVVMS